MTKKKEKEDVHPNRSHFVNGKRTLLFFIHDFSNEISRGFENRLRRNSNRIRIRSAILLIE